MRTWPQEYFPLVSGVLGNRMMRSKKASVYKPNDRINSPKSFSTIPKPCYATCYPDMLVTDLISRICVDVMVTAYTVDLLQLGISEERLSTDSEGTD